MLMYHLTAGEHYPAARQYESPPGWEGSVGFPVCGHLRFGVGEPTENGLCTWRLVFIP
jgi:hypothetical protein